jgi:hypothetical protein
LELPRGVQFLAAQVADIDILAGQSGYRIVDVDEVRPEGSEGWSYYLRSRRGEHMSDWDFLHEMHTRGNGPSDIADAAACGYAPWESPWEWVDIPEQELPQPDQPVDPELCSLFESLVDTAKKYHEITGRYLQIWGELGELYAEVKHGIKRHKPHAKGSDGKLGNDFVEVKTISPEKSREQVQVKFAGNFNKLLVVKIAKDFQFESRLIARKALPKGDSSHAQVSWSTLPAEEKHDRGENT